VGLEKDVLEKVVGPELMRLVVEMKRKNMEARMNAGGVKAGFLKGLSFKKQRQVVDLPEMVVGNEQRVKDECDVEKREEEEEAEEEEAKEEEEEEEEVVVERPPKKKPKLISRQQRPSIVVKRSKKNVEDEEIESEEEDPGDLIKLAEMTGDVVHHYHHHHRHKRSMSREVEEGEQPLRKKLKLDKGLKSNKGAKRRPRKVMMMVMEEEEVQVPVTPSASRSPSPVPRKQTKRSKPRVVTPPPTPPPPDPMKSGLCEDDEDLYYTKLVLSGSKSSLSSSSPSSPSSSPSPEEEEEEEDGISTSSLLVTPPEENMDTPWHAKFRTHDTGSARTEGYYKITHAEKAEYVAQYQQTTRMTDASAPVVEDFPSRQRQHHQHHQQGQVSSSRSNRATARRRAQGLEEMKELQHAILLSKGEMASAHDLMFKFNQLQTRKKHLRFAKSPIHDWGLYAMERVSRGEMVIEYVGEVIRAAVADKREKAYERQGIGSSYLFRIDEDLVVDATKKGNLG